MKPNENQLISSELTRMPAPTLALQEEVYQALWTCLRHLSGLPNLPDATLRNSKKLVIDLGTRCPEVIVGVMRSAWLGSALN